MPWIRPALKELVARVSRDFSAKLLDGAALQEKSVLAVLAKVWAGACHLLHGFFVWLIKAVMPDSAAAEFLDRWLAVWGVARKSAQTAKGTVTVTGAAGAVIPPGTQVKNADGIIYIIPDGALIPPSGEIKAAVEAMEAGSAGNMAAGTLALVISIAGINASLTISPAGITGGLDTEGDTPARERMLKKIQEPPHGGNTADYEMWALEIPGVTDAWCYPEYAGPATGTVGVAFIVEDTGSGIIPAAPKIGEVYRHILEVCPVTARSGLLVFAPQALDIDFHIKITPDTPAVQAAIIKELGDLFREAHYPGAIIRLSRINEAISIAPGEADHILIAPTADIIAGATEIPVLGTFTFEAV